MLHSAILTKGRRSGKVIRLLPATYGLRRDMENPRGLNP